MSTRAPGETPSGPEAGGPRVLVVDDQPMIRHSLRLILTEAGIPVVGEASSGPEALDVARAERPDVVLMDIRMPGGDGLNATRHITTDPSLVSTRVLVLTMFELDEYVHQALLAGASGFLLKDAHPDQLVDAVRRAHQGESLFAPSVLRRLVEHYVRTRTPARPAVPTDLTPRETEVLRLVGAGRSNTEIAAALFISMGTVKTHVGNLLTKLAARDRAQLVIAAYDFGLVHPTYPQGTP